MEQIIFNQLSLDEFKAVIAGIVEEKIKPLLHPAVSKDSETYLSRKEVSEQLKISLPTLHKLTLSGKIKGSRLNGGRRILYKPDEVQAALQEIVTNKYKRKNLI